MSEPESDKIENESPGKQPNKLLIPAVIAALSIVVAGQAWYLVDLNKQVRDLRASNDADTVMAVETLPAPAARPQQPGKVMAQANKTNPEPVHVHARSTSQPATSQSTTSANNGSLAQNNTPVPSQQPFNDPIFNDPFFQQALNNPQGNWDPYRDMERMQHEMDAMMRNAYQRYHLGPYANAQDVAMPGPQSGFDIEDKGNGYLVKLNLPGADKNNVNVKLHDNVLTVSGEQHNKQTRQDANGNTVFSEQQTSAFSRSVALPSDIKPGSMHSKFNKDTLEITVSKTA